MTLCEFLATYYVVSFFWTSANLWLGRYEFADDLSKQLDESGVYAFQSAAEIDSELPPSGISTCMDSPSNARRLSARDKEIAALNLRRKGYSYRQIAAELGCHEDTIYHSVKRALAKLCAEIKESAEEVRRLEIERYDGFLKALQPAIEDGDVKAISTALRISEARRKLLGLDIPVKHEVEIKSQLPEDQLAQVQAELLRKLEQLPSEDKQ